MKSTSVIQDIFNGKKGHVETMHNKNKDKVLLDTLTTDHKNLISSLSPELLALHDKFVNSLELVHLQDVDFYFTQGFKLGLQIGIETMQDE